MSNAVTGYVKFKMLHKKEKNKAEAVKTMLPKILF
jgi:hypothetical protein